jgi:AraC-like DNA-binding protein
VIDYLVAAAAPIGEGIRRFSRYFGLIAEGVSLGITDADEEHGLCLGRADGGHVPADYADYIFAALVIRIRMRIRPELQVRRVELCQPEPEAPGPYREAFGAPVHFGCPADWLWFSDEEWRSPTAGADAALARLIEEHARILAHRLPQPAGFAAQVQKAIAAAPHEGGSAPDVARALNVSVRTLQRKLVATGTTFREVSEGVRGRLAQGYLTDRRVSIAEVAFLLGFSDQSSFNRAFRRWTGQSPGRWRRRQA